MCNEAGTKWIVPKYMTFSELSEYSGIPIKCIRKMVKSGEVDHFRPGSKTIYVSVESFMALCSGCNQR